ncbi:GntR family transcriptional regulator [Sediminispirochaeta smaragdinae]|uniref:Transcriptional regulator, GntR family n=1 Tax=Sediminispirochaeta smaragdinae (strain DSM 11293 / JCM 15392 / SEBR 4228) TaxID=573413 RepID=E1RC57_SEDSS|nr:GntR family transcriptional regulator [Sediminispirochaeta smaragdinae]ADK79937.1 transcriptional regulator, GntR family [Sediminispirochaeta smaragdinae DSM 11293]
MKENQNKIELKSLNQECYERIKQEILMGHMDWGQRIDIIQIAGNYGISRSPVVKAVDRLSMEGFIDILPNKGSFVARPSLQRINEVTEIRLMLETYSLKLSMEKERKKLLQDLQENQKLVAEEKNKFEDFLLYDRNFHLIIARHTGNSRLLELFENTRNQVEFFRIHTFIPAQVSLAIRRHTEIIEAITDNNRERGIERLEIHLKEVYNDSIKSFPSETVHTSG